MGERTMGGGVGDGCLTWQRGWERPPLGKSPWLLRGQSLKSCKRRAIASEKGSWYNQWQGSLNSPSPIPSYPRCGKPAPEPAAWLLCQCLLEWSLCGSSDSGPVKSGDRRAAKLQKLASVHVWLFPPHCSWEGLLTKGQVQKNSSKRTFSWVRSREAGELPPVHRRQRGMKWAFWDLPDSWHDFSRHAKSLA